MTRGSFVAATRPVDFNRTHRSLNATVAVQLVDVNMPLDNATGRHRGFGFVEYEAPEDAVEAIFNMNNGELNGRVLNVNTAKPMTVTERSQKAVWHAEADSYFDKEGWNLDEDPSAPVADDGALPDDGLAPKVA